MRSLPPEFIEMVTEIGLKELPDVLSSGVPDVSIRLNHNKEKLEHEGLIPVKWCESGYYLDRRPKFTLDPAFHQGRYYVQEASSMFHYHVMKTLVADGRPRRVLDACAAPGGKTTAAIDTLPAGSVIVANEYVPNRAAILRENVIKWGFPASIVTRADTRDLGKLKDCFDIVIADVPCSGEGMMRKDDEAVAQWSAGLIEECVDRQWQIIENLWNALRPGGELVYSTCTFNRHENEEMIARIIERLGGESVEIPVDATWNIHPGIDTPHHCYRFIPGKIRGEGLFVAVIRKNGIYQPREKKHKTSKGSKTNTSPLLSQVRDRLTDMEHYELYIDDDRITAFPKAHIDLLQGLKSKVDVIHEGVTLGTVKGKDIIPAQSLAMAQNLNTASFTTADVIKEEALKYLHGDAVNLPETTSRGIVLLTYSGSPLGFVKNLGNRSNNLYPALWRIRQLNQGE